MGGRVVYFSTHPPDTVERLEDSLHVFGSAVSLWGVDCSQVEDDKLNKVNNDEVSELEAKLRLAGATN